MTRYLIRRGSAIISSVAAVLLCAVLQPVPAHGQLPPWLPCLATVTNSGISAYTKVWVTGSPAGWQYTWNWSIDYDCSDDQYPRCIDDHAQSVAIVNPGTGQFGPPSWQYYCENDFACGGVWTNNLTTTVPTLGGWAPGTEFRVVFYGVAHDPNVTDCYEQNYDVLFTKQVIAPAAP